MLLIRVEESLLIQYPSITVCKEYTYKKYIDDIILGNLTLEETENVVKTHLWNRNETFYFVNQKYTNRNGFPCMTTTESTDPGRPCSFPLFNSIGEKFYNCSLARSTVPWCYTKVNYSSGDYLNNEFVGCKYSHTLLQ